MTFVLSDRRARMLAGLLALAAGALFSLGFLPVPGETLGVSLCALGLLLLFLAEGEARSGRRCALYGFLFGLAAYGAGLSWVWNSIHFYGGIPAPLAAGAVLLLAAANALFPAAAGYAAGRLSPQGPGRVFVFALCFFFTDWLRGSALCSFPWISFGYALADEALALLVAPLAGAWGVELAGLLALALLASFFFQKTSRLTIAAAAVLAGGLGLLFVAADGAWSEPAGMIRVRLVQPALPVAGVPGAERLSLSERIERAMALSRTPEDAPRAEPPGLIVWPESVIPTSLQRIPAETLESFGRGIEALGAPLVFNAFWEEAPGRFSNSAFLALEGEPLQRYDKRHLVPFGEYVPAGFRWFVDALGIPMADQVPGRESQKAFQTEDIAIAPMICYENLFGDELRAFWKKGSEVPDLLLVTSNLAWFSSPVQFQHLQMSRMRAMETATPLVSASNNGMSAAIDARGRVIALAGKAPCSLDAEVPLASGGPTPYSRLGDAPAVLSGALFLAIALFFGCLRQKRKNKTPARI